MVNTTDNPWPYGAPVQPVRRQRRWPWIVAIVAAFVLGLVFGLTARVAPESAPAAQSAPSTAPTAEYSAPPAAPPASVQYEVAEMGGEVFTYEDGLVVSTTTPKVYEPGRYAITGENPVAVRFDVTVTNNGSKPFDPTFFGVDASYGGQPASQIIDISNKIGASPQTKVLPGKSITFSVAFSIIEGPGEFQVDLRPSWSHNSSTFAGPIG